MVVTSSIVEQCLEWLDRMRGHEVTVVGEDIVDEYVHVRPAGKSAKDNLVTFVRDGSQLWPGGARIIRYHLEEMGCQVRLCTSIRPIIKTRYIDTAFNQKVFSVCNNDHVPDMKQAPIKSAHLLIADFGHQHSPLPIGGDFVSLMVQSNSLNWGFNLLTKYQKADYIVCDQAELHLACCDPYGEIATLMKDLAHKMHVKLLALTRGHEGAILLDLRDVCNWHHFPAYAGKVVDRMGAGDAFLAASAPLAAMDAPAEVVGLVGSVAAGLHVEKEGNPPLCREELAQRLKEINVSDS